MDPGQFAKPFMDPTQFTKQFYEQMEKNFIDKINEMIHNPSFPSSISKSVESGLDGKKKTDDLMKTYLEKMNMPTREDTAKILQYLQKMESRIIELEEKIEDLQDEIKKQNKKSSKNSMKVC
jgi:polyhydroxyalkanoic acid synthase PhaR subunit